MHTSPNWFEIHKPGLSDILARRGKAFAVNELIQNAWDENVTRVQIELRTVSPGLAELIVEDDSPGGFRELADAYTLFAPSAKKSQAAKRGRFNVGEKLVLALTEHAQICTTTGRVTFSAKGRTLDPGRRREVGTRFVGRLRLTAEEVSEIASVVRRLIVPAGIITTFNGAALPAREPLAVVSRALPTEVAGEDGVLRRTTRTTEIRFHLPVNGESAAIYELGIPVVDTGDKYSVDVQQKLPLNLDRDNVTPSCLAALRACMLEVAREQLTAEDANSTWVKHALQTHAEDLPDPVIKKVLTLRFGERRVAYDPSDLEANYRAVEEGYALVHGGALSSAEWKAAKRLQAIPPAGQVTPTPKPFSEDGKPLTFLDRSEWSPAVGQTVEYMQRVAGRLLGGVVQARVTDDPAWPFRACYGERGLILNLGVLGEGWFAGGLEPINQLLIHELGHSVAPHHLSAGYHEALCVLGAKLTSLALSDPGLFNRQADGQGTAPAAPAVRHRLGTQVDIYKREW